VFAVIRAIRNKMPDFPLNGDPRNKKTQNLAYRRSTLKESWSSEPNWR